MAIYSDFDQIPILHYPVICADPPTQYRTYSEEGQDRSPERHYPTMPFEDIERFTVADIAAPDSVLFLWTTGTLTATPRHKMITTTSWAQRALSDIESCHISLMNAWGFECKALAFVWVKTNKCFTGDAVREADWFGGLGKYTSQNVELCYVGTRGKPGMPIEKMLPQVVVAPVREHSRKPDIVMDRIRRMYRGPRIELFSRQDKPGFDAFGNEVHKFSGEQDT